MLSDQGRSSHRRCSVRKDVCRNFATFTGKHLRQSLFFNKAAGISNFIKNEALAQVLSCDFTKFLIATFSQNTSGGCFCQEYFWITSWKPMLYVYLLQLLQRIRLLNKKNRCCIYKKNIMSLPEDVILCSRTKTRVLIWPFSHMHVKLLS